MNVFAWILKWMRSKTYTVLFLLSKSPTSFTPVDANRLVTLAAMTNYWELFIFYS